LDPDTYKKRHVSGRRPRPSIRTNARLLSSFPSRRSATHSRSISQILSNYHLGGKHREREKYALYPKRSFIDSWLFTISLQTRFCHVWSSRTSSFCVFTTTSATCCGLWYVERPSCAQTLRLTSLSCLRRVAPSCPIPGRSPVRPHRTPTSTTCTPDRVRAALTGRCAMVRRVEKCAI
jgi:hypothetical protein